MASKSSVYMESKKTTTITETRTDGGILDPAYYRGFPAVFKAIEAIASLVAFICIMVASYCTKSSITAGYFKFVTITAFILTLIVWFLFIFKLQFRIFKCSCINWSFIMFPFYAVICIFYFLADIILAVQACSNAEKAAIVFGFIAFIAFFIDLVMSIVEYIKVRRLSTTTRHTVEASGAADNDKY